MLVLLLLAVIAIAGGAALVLRSGTGRTFGRVVDGRLLLDAADAALAEAVVHLRHSADTGAPVAGATDEDWRKLLTGVFLTGATRPPPSIVHPVRTRAVYAEEAPGLGIGDVRVSVVLAHPGLPSPPAGQPVLPRQGVLELAVRVEGDRPTLGRSARVVRQRRIFYVTDRRVTGAHGHPVSELTFVLPPHPLGTVIE